VNRLQKKCAIASAGIHLLLVVILLVGPGFLGSSQKQAKTQYIDIIPLKIIEGTDVGGGTPHATPPPPAPVQPPTPTPAPPQPQPQPQTQPPKLSADALQVHQRLPSVSTKLVTRSPESKNKPTTQTAEDDSKAQAKAEAQARSDAAKRAAGFRAAVQNIREGSSSSTSIDVPGPGGEAYAGYETVLQSIYKARYDEALAGAGDIARGTVQVETSVTVARDGNVLRHRIVGRSSNAALNDLVARVLDRVTFIRPFPESVKDAERTFNIIFDLKPREGIG
jgi:outer membrane biosynthesis protein TonB